MYTGDIFMRYMIKLKDILFEVLEGKCRSMIFIRTSRLN